MFFQGIRHEVSPGNAVFCYSKGSCIFSILVGTREQLQCADPSGEESRQPWVALAKLQLVHCFLLGGIAQAASVKMNGVATALVHVM